MKKDKTFLILYLSIAMTFVTCGILVFFFKVIENKNKHTGVVEMTLEDKMIKKEKSFILKDKIFEIEEIKNELESHFLNPEEIDVFVGYLEDIGKKMGVKLVVKNVDILKNESNRINVKISMNGDFPNIMKTISYLENSPYQISVVQLFLNENIGGVSGEEDSVSTDQASYASKWQADLSFNILTL